MAERGLLARCAVLCDEGSIGEVAGTGWIRFFCIWRFMRHAALFATKKENYRKYQSDEERAEM